METDGALYILGIELLIGVATQIVCADQKQDDLGMQFGHMIFHEDYVPVGRVPIQPGIVYPDIMKALVQPIAQAGRPGFVVRQEKALGRAASDTDNRELARQVWRWVRSPEAQGIAGLIDDRIEDRKSTRLNSSHVKISYA